MFLKSLASTVIFSAVMFAGEPPVVPLWANGAPGSEAKKGIPEKVESTGNNEQRVSSIHNPSLTIYLPEKSKANGAAVIVAPGGGHRFLSITHEGYQVGEWLASIGVAGFVLKHRLAREEGSTYKIEVEAVADSQRAIRLVRSRAKEWGIDPAKVGFMGFSAGGELVGFVGSKFDAGNPEATDPIDRPGSRPDYLMFIYPGGIAAQQTYTKDTPPAFLMSAYNDRGPTAANLAVFQALQKAGVPADLHIWTEGGHGFGIRNRPIPISTWPQRVQEWMANRGFIPKQ